VFGKRKSVEAAVRSDDRRRIFDEADFARHGELFRATGLGIDDPRNVVETRADFDRLIAQSLQAQELRRQGIEAELLARHGCNNIRPFFLFSEGVYKTQAGDWLIRVMRLMPYDDWNITYLPMDAKTAAALQLPLHPQCSIGPIEELINSRISALWDQFREALGRSRVEFERTQDIEILARFNGGVDRMRAGILAWAGEISPMVIALIADVQKKA